MRRDPLALLLVLLLLLAPLPALAQDGHAGHAMPAAPESPPPAPPAGHAGHAMPGMPETPAQTPPPAPAGHEGHAMPGAPESPPAPPAGHAGHAGHGAPAQGQAGPPTITISPDIMRAMGVRTAPVSRQPMQRVIRAAGRVEIDERTLVAVTTKVEGWVEKLYADFTGKPVKKGDPLAAIYSPEVMAVELEYLRLLAWADKAAQATPGAPETVDPALSLGSRDAQALLAAARERLKLYDVGPGLARALEKTRRPVRAFTLASPVNGFVVRKMALAGTKVMPGEKLFELADLSTVWVIAEIYEYELPWVQPGRKAEVRLSGLPDAPYPAVVDYVYPTFSDETRTAKIRFVLKNPKEALRPGMYAQTEIRVTLGERLAVPREAVIDTGERHIAYVEARPGAFELREVKIGVEAGDMVEVISGLKAGENVAATAAFLIDSETRLKGAGAAGGHHH